MLASLRLAVLALVLFMLAQFVLLLQRTGLPYVAVILDDSLSMTIADRYPNPLAAALEDRLRETGFSGLTRWNLARAILAHRNGELPRAILDRYKLRFYNLSSTAPRLPDLPEEIVSALRDRQPSAETTALGAAIRDVLDDLRGSPPAAIVLLTDGINTEGPSLEEGAALARRRGVPLVFVALGDDRPVRDLQLSDLVVDDVVFLGDVVYFEARLSASGYSGRTARVLLREQGKPRMLAEVAIPIGPEGRSQQIRIPYRPTQEGEFNFVLEVEPQEGELATDNNRLARTVRVRKEKIRVLLVQADPGYEFRYLRNMLAQRRHDRVEDRAPERRPRTLGPGCPRAALLPDQPRRVVPLRRRDPQRRRPRPAQPLDARQPRRFRGVAGPRRR